MFMLVSPVSLPADRDSDAAAGWTGRLHAACQSHGVPENPAERAVEQDLCVHTTADPLLQPNGIS
jgi:hypothetical protein